MAAVLIAGSCSQDEIVAPVEGQEVKVTFTTELPQGIATRADEKLYSQGNLATTLHYGYYVAGTNVNLNTTNATVQFVDKKATVELTLATGVSYDFIFWADDNAEGLYTIDWEKKTMTVDYTKMAANDDTNDAFYHFEAAYKVNGAISDSFELRRPFAQINLGTDDFDAAAAAGLAVDRSNMVITDVPNVLDFVNGGVSGDAEITIAAAAFDNTVKFPVDGYKYLGMNYILAGSQSSTHDCTFNIWKTGAEKALEPNVKVTGVPVQRNHRTNIYGSLLTDPAKFVVEIKADYTEPDNMVSVWDGVSATEFTEAELAAPEIKLESAADIAGLAKVMSDSGNNNMFAGQTITLTSDIDLNNIEWNPIGNIDDGTPAGVFGGTFDGNGHTIKNLKAKSVTTGKNPSAGLFGGLRSGAVVKNVTIVGAEITSGKYAGAIAGHVNGADIQIINCHVSDVVIISKGKSAGGIAGHVTDGTFENCTATNVTVKVDDCGGGLLGRIQFGTVKNCAVTNATVLPYTEGKTGTNLDSFIGGRTNTFTLEGTNTVDGVEVTL